MNVIRRFLRTLHERDKDRGDVFRVQGFLVVDEVDDSTPTSPPTFTRLKDARRGLEGSVIEGARVLFADWAGPVVSIQGGFDRVAQTVTLTLQGRPPERYALAYRVQPGALFFMSPGAPLFPVRVGPTLMAED